VSPFEAVAIQLLAPGVVWLVDERDGLTIILGVQAYVTLTSADLAGLHAFFRPDSAARFAAAIHSPHVDGQVGGSPDEKTRNPQGSR
jgi:hypothetical protein